MKALAPRARGANDPYRAPKTTLEAEINEAAWATLNSDTSRLPLLIAALVQSRWPPWAKAVAALLACVVVALVAAYLAGQLSRNDLVGSVLTVLVAAISSYKGLWQPTGIAPAIERATNLSRSEELPRQAMMPLNLYETEVGQQKTPAR
ncbi:MAG: hypothetical protein HY690_07895 [Chloroflexi bacterium]|nr:hypothetical protein [Chloroflexota bacterium]